MHFAPEAEPSLSKRVLVMRKNLDVGLIPKGCD